jgi:hypothetical protein
LLHVAGNVARGFLPFANIRSALAILLGVVAATAARGDAGRASIGVAAPYEVLAHGFEQPSGLAVQPDGTVLVTDRRAGTLTRITAAGVRQVILSNLHEPLGIAAGLGGVFVLERTRVLRLDPNGVLSVASEPLKRARAIASGPDGRVWVAARREHGPEDEILRLDESGVLMPVSSGFIGIRALTAGDAGLYVAVRALSGERRDHTTIAWLSWGQDGVPGRVESLLRNTTRKPGGVAIDAAGDVFVTGSWFEHRHAPAGFVLKRRAEGWVAFIASGLWRPGPAAFGPARDLFVIDHGPPARVVRFRPPPAPVVSVPPFTNRMPVAIQGRAQAGSLVQAMQASPPGPVLAAGAADTATGAFVLSALVRQNAETGLSITATASGGNGLVGVAAIASVVHDDHLPAVEILEPFASGQVREAVAVRARAADEGSGMLTLDLMIDQALVASVPAAPPAESLTAAAVINMAPFREGPHTLTARAADRAGNWAAAARLIMVDRTPPDTFLLAGPPVESADRNPTFSFGASDEQSSDFEFSWRLDAAPWSAFSGATEVQLADVAAGRHRFEVVARDRAGNVDAVPAGQTFTVTTLGLRIVQPTADARIETQTVWVHGTVDGGPDVTLRILLPPAFQEALSLEALPAPHEGGTFAAEVPVVSGMAALTVIARDRAGVETSDTVAIDVVEPLSPALRLEPFPAAGLAPHTVRFPGNRFPSGSVYTLDLESDGIIDYAGNTFPEREFIYAKPGIYLATLRALTPANQALLAQAAVEVYDRARLEARLRSAWSGFKTAMRAGDAATAASFVHSDRRAAWAEYFGRLTPAQFANTDAMFTDLTLLEVAPGRVECELMRDEGGLFYSFPVSFEIDVDGGWKLWQF